jgi:hypothetical protein
MGGKNVVVTKPCGYCNHFYHYYDIAIISYKHTFLLFCLRIMLYKSNKYGVCKQKVHLDWWSSCTICEEDEEMKELAQGMHFENLKQDMVNNDATLTWSSMGVKPNTWKSWGFGVLRDSRMFRARQQEPKHLELGCSWCHWKGLEA